MTPTPDAKGAQPEQLVEAARDAIAWLADGCQDDNPTDAYTTATDALTTLATALSECREALNVAGGDFLRIKDRIEQGEYGAAASIAYDSWYRAAVAAPGLAAQPPSEASERSGT